MKKTSPFTVGWKEWLSLPELDIHHIKAKIDTGARTSALHAFDVEPYKVNDKPHVRFKLHPFQKDDATTVNCEAEIFDQRYVTDSGGHRELRFVIKTPVALNGMTWPIEITLTNRDSMGFRMLLGRTAMYKRLIVDPSQAHLTTLE